MIVITLLFLQNCFPQKPNTVENKNNTNYLLWCTTTVKKQAKDTTLPMHFMLVTVVGSDMMIHQWNQWMKIKCYIQLLPEFHTSCFTDAVTQSVTKTKKTKCQRTYLLTLVFNFVFFFFIAWTLIILFNQWKYLQWYILMITCLNFWRTLLQKWTLLQQNFTIINNLNFTVSLKCSSYYQILSRNNFTLLIILLWVFKVVINLSTSIDDIDQCFSTFIELRTV